MVSRTLVSFTVANMRKSGRKPINQPNKNVETDNLFLFFCFFSTFLYPYKLSKKTAVCWFFILFPANNVHEMEEAWRN
jgi:hypothetical protein